MLFCHALSPDAIQPLCCNRDGQEINPSAYRVLYLDMPDPIRVAPLLLFCPPRPRPPVNPPGWGEKKKKKK